MAPRFSFWLITFAIFALTACSQEPSYHASGNEFAYGRQDLGSIDPTAPGFADGLLGRRVSTSRSHDVGPMPRWQKVIARFSQEERSPAAACSGSAEATCPAEIWKQVVAELKTLPLRERVERVNDIFNRVPYIPAEVNWHDIAYWETPYEFLAHGGQCQDYAIAKYMALLESGVPEQKLRFVVVHDNQVQLDHAITVVDVDGVSLALDNQMKSVVPAQSLQQRYSPYYALNDLGWWSYMSAEATQVAWQPPTVNTAALFVSRFRVPKY
jgi:predicted transglutaminase-like cysteine proteinase